MPESMSEQERYEQGCLSRDIPEFMGAILVEQQEALE